MYCYELYGLRVQSNIEFPQLLAIDEFSEDSAEIEMLMENNSINSDSDEARQDQKKGYGLTENGVWFYNQAGYFDIKTENDKTTIRCAKYSDVDESIVRSFFLGNCVALGMTQRNKIVLHGSTLLMGDKTILICGNSGSGKSTTAMALIEKGAKLIADDISVIDVETSDGCAYAYPAFPEQKLCRDAVEYNHIDVEKLSYVNEDRDKFSYIRKDVFENKKKKVDGMIAIRTVEGTNEEVSIRKIDGADKVNAITDKFFLNWLYGHGLELHPKEMMKCFALAGQIDIWDVSRTCDGDTRVKLVNSILDVLKD